MAKTVWACVHCATCTVHVVLPPPRFTGPFVVVLVAGYSVVGSSVSPRR